MTTRSLLYKLIQLMMLSGLASTPALAQRGGAGPGGGDSVARPNGQRSLLDLVEKDSELDYFIYKAGDYTNGYQGWVGDGVDSLEFGSNYGGPAADTLGGLPLSIREPLSACLTPTSPSALRWAFVDFPLEDIKDEGEIRYSDTESKRQLAIQKGNIVVINRSEFKQLDNVSQSMLKLHEGLICAAKVFNPYLHSQSGTEKIRRVVRSFVQLMTENKPRFLWEEAVKELNATSEGTVTLPVLMPSGFKVIAPVIRGADLQESQTVVVWTADHSRCLDVPLGPHPVDYIYTWTRCFGLDVLAQPRLAGAMKAAAFAHRTEILNQRARIMSEIDSKQRAGLPTGY